MLFTKPGLGSHFFCQGAVRAKPFSHLGIKGIEGFQYDGEPENVQQTHRPQEEEPEQHDRTERLADFTGAGELDTKENRDDQQGDQNHTKLAVAQKTVHDLDAAQAFHCGGNGHSGGEHAVCQQCRTAQHIELRILRAADKLTRQQDYHRPCQLLGTVARRLAALLVFVVGFLFGQRIFVDFLESVTNRIVV